jgi:phage shock protein C
MNNNRLFRDTNHKVIGGVASGLAEYLQTDVTIIRVLFVLAIFIPLNFPVVLLYILLWIVMPDIAKRPKIMQNSSFSS